MSKRIQLSTNFFLDEFSRSQAAARLGQVVEVEPGSEIYQNLERLCRSVLQPLRDHLERPIFISSGYRPEWLNTAVRGSRTSAHMYGLAADFEVSGMTPLQAATELAFMQEGALPWEQLIHEFGEWVHVSVPAQDAPPSRERLTSYTGLVRGQLRTLYANGLHEVEALTGGE